MKGVAHQRGYLLLIAIAIIVIIGFIGVAASKMYLASSRSNTDFLMSQQALYSAEAGLEAGTRGIDNPDISNRRSCSPGYSSAMPYDSKIGHILTYPGTTPSRDSAISNPVYASSFPNGNFSASATTIAVQNASVFARAGRVMIDREEIDYGGIDNQGRLIMATRGVDGTVAAGHNSNTPLSQYQCVQQVEGITPYPTNLSANPGDPQGKRTLTQGITMQDGWFISSQMTGGSYVSNVNTNVVYTRWNSLTSQMTWSNGLSFPYTRPFDLQKYNDISILSYSDAWAVGNFNSFAHWNGLTWNLTSAGPTSPYITFKGVHCQASTYCLAVGSAHSGNVSIYLSSNNSSWSLNAPAVAHPNNLNSVHCAATSNQCWAVGDAAGGNYFLYMNGSGSWTFYSFGGSSFPYNSVYCNSTYDCWAVGATGEFARYNYDGVNPPAWVNTNWGLTNGVYKSVFCNTTNDCWAVGANTTTSPATPLIARWNGSTWTNIASPVTQGNLNKVACYNKNDCWAVGANATGGALLLHYNGASTATNKWSQVAFSTTEITALALVGAHEQPRTGWNESF